MCFVTGQVWVRLKLVQVDPEAPVRWQNFVPAEYSVAAWLEGGALPLPEGLRTKWEERLVAAGHATREGAGGDAQQEGVHVVLS